MIIKKYLHDIVIAIEAIFANKVKSLLTALGIIFGVAAVISMMAIGNGAEQEILEQIKMVGVNNIIVTPSELSTSDNSNSDSEDKSSTKKFSKGLTLLDAEAIGSIIPSVDKVCPVVSFNYSAMVDGKSKPVVLEGTNENYFELFNISLQSGEIFNEFQDKSGQPVCVIGDNIREVFFKQDDPIGKSIKCGKIWLKVIGIAERRDFTASASDEMGISSSDNKIFVPIQTLLLRFKDRSLIRADEVEKVNSNKGGNGGVIIIGGMEQKDDAIDEDPDINQLSKIIIQVKETEQLSATANVTKKMLLRRHSGLFDFEVTIPELLLKQQQRTKNIFNIVLGAIAGISLIVGGIGIMNIMLASVLERIREIGLRLSIGASKKDIIAQFLAESTLISISGGIIGIIFGVALSKTITAIFDIKTVVSFFSIFIAFGVSALVGISFGYLPAKQAAEKDPIESLRQ
ncbi:ABC transporter permease [Mangrovibacterium diazotrophicum]|uniref:Putative ABC transport system permease protein n=1 Tax=Mangrovibacterium diazotrophicum TaxID=1261403 RepID=A0A419W886_9BACT|nr:ABC transporter permease [Mangrovibacterium diazotrophicum]RKD91683.1 putative ABC transport system permease protein [Mangrovibacterium diazotrophicum]